MPPCSWPGWAPGSSRSRTRSGGDSCRHNPPYVGAGGLRLAREAPDDMSVSSLNRLRNKLGVTLNLKHPAARDVFLDLARRADILVENFSRGVLDRLGVGYAFVHEVNPRLVYCSISGFGSTGGADDGKAMDTIIQALSGVMYTSGQARRPAGARRLPHRRPGVAALRRHRRAGRAASGAGDGRGPARGRVDAGRADLAHHRRALRCAAAVRRADPHRSRPCPAWRPSASIGATDGYVAICAFTDPFAHALFRAMDEPGAARRPAVRDARHARAACQRDGCVRGTVDAGATRGGHPGDARAGIGAVRGGAGAGAGDSRSARRRVAATRCRSSIRYTAAWPTSTAPACRSPSPRPRRASPAGADPGPAQSAGLRRTARVFAGASRRSAGERRDLGLRQPAPGAARRRNTMRLIPLIPAALIVLASAPAWAQDWRWSRRPRTASVPTSRASPRSRPSPTSPSSRSACRAASTARPTRWADTRRRSSTTARRSGCTASARRNAWPPRVPTSRTATPATNNFMPTWPARRITRHGTSSSATA